MRRAHDFIKFNAAITECESCGGLKLSHHVCKSCGFYRGIKVLNVKDSGEESIEELASEEEGE